MKWFLLITILVIAPSLCGFSTKEALNHVSFSDKIYMRSFAKQSIESKHAAHVIFFDNKAVSSGGCILKGRDKRYKDVLYLKGWLAFKRNEHLFPHPNFLLEEQVTDMSESFFGYGRFKLMGISIINKKSLVKCLDQHFNLFKETLGPEFDSSEFISELEKGTPLGALISDNEMLLGILLGFGEESSKAYRDEQLNLIPGVFPTWRDTYCGIDIKRPKGCKIYPLIFMGNPHSEEVQHIAATYEQELDEFWRVYKKEDPLLLFLKCICEEI